PVGDLASRSCPARMSGMTNRCTAKGSTISARASSLQTTSDMPRPANVSCVMLVMLLVFPATVPAAWLRREIRLTDPAAPKSANKTRQEPHGRPRRPWGDRSRDPAQPPGGEAQPASSGLSLGQAALGARGLGEPRIGGEQGQP